MRRSGDGVRRPALASRSLGEIGRKKTKANVGAESVPADTGFSLRAVPLGEVYGVFLVEMHL